MVKLYVKYLAIAGLLSFMGVSIAIAQDSIVMAQATEKVKLTLTLDQAIEMASEQSVQSFKNKNMYLSKYWQFRSYRGSKLPSLSFEAIPLKYRSNYVYLDASKKYEYRQDLTTKGVLSLSQNVALTGGQFSVNSSLDRFYDYSDNKTQFYSIPLSLEFDQPLNGYNEFRWLSKIEPLKFEIAKRDFIQSIEDLSIKTVQYFFSVVADEINLKIAETNYRNADTLYLIAKGRFEIGTVTQDELLDFELGLLNAKINITKSKLSLTQSQIGLNSFLGFDKSISIACIVPNNIPQNDLDVSQVLNLAMENNPDLLSYQQNLLEAQKQVAFAKSNSGFRASLIAGYGNSKSDEVISNMYQSPFEEDQHLALSISVPIIDWGERRGKIQMAKAEKQVTESEVKQQRIDFEQSVYQQAMEYNFQDEQVAISAKADTVSQLGYEVTKQRFLIGKVDVMKLNAARNSVDAARRNYVDALRRYWNYYYTIRRLSLYDFENNLSLIKELDYLLEK